MKKQDLLVNQTGSKNEISSSSGPYNYDSSDIEKIRIDYQNNDEQRETVIKKSREILKAAKQSIYSLHRGDVKSAEKLMKSAENAAQELLPLIHSDPYLRQGTYSSGLEEYAEARIFHGFLTQGKIPDISQLPLVNRDEYLGGLFDFAGELNRFAVMKATARDVQCVKNCRDLLDNLMFDFLKFDFRNGNLRKKFDSLKYTIKKLENTIYELTLLEGMGRKSLNREEVNEEEDKIDETQMG